VTEANAEGDSAGIPSGSQRRRDSDAGLDHAGDVRDVLHRSYAVSRWPLDPTHSPQSL
jgi:hypothetical protein